MQKLVRQMNADTGADKTVTRAGDTLAETEAISTLDSAAWARILQQPAVRALLACLEPLNVTPLVEHRVVRVLLRDPAAIGMQIVTGKCKPVQVTLRAPLSCMRTKQACYAHNASLAFCFKWGSFCAAQRFGN